MSHARSPFSGVILAVVVASTLSARSPFAQATPGSPSESGVPGTARPAKLSFAQNLPTQPRQGFADVPGARLWFTDTGGTGEPVVFMHAATGTSESWHPQISPFAKAGYRVIAFDRRGWGKSVTDPATGPQPGTAAEDLAALADFLKLDRFHLVGVAAGAQVALDYAAWRRDRLRSLVLAATLGPATEPEVAAFNNRITIPDLNQLSAEYREVGPSYRGDNPEGTRRWREIAETARQPGAQRQPFRLPNDYTKLKLIRVRTLVMPGDADLISPPGMMKLWAARINDAEWTTVPDAGHSVAWERPEIFNEHVLRFLRGRRPFEKVSATLPVLTGAARVGGRSPRPETPAARREIATLPGVRLWFTDTGGKGEPVVLLHAITGTSESWEPQIEAFSKAGYRVIAFDRRGWGKSIANPATGPQPGHASEDLQALADYLTLDRFHLVGVAGGGFVALDYAAWHGDRLMSLVIGASTGSVSEREILDFSTRITIPGLTALSAHYREIGASYRGATGDGTQRWLAIHEHARQPEVPSQPLRSLNTFAKLETIAVRTLVLAAGADLIAPPGLMKVWARHVKDAQWTDVPDAGHSIGWEQPEIFNAHVLRFLRGGRPFTNVRDLPKT